MSQEKKKSWWKRTTKEWLPEIIALIILIVFTIFFILPSGLKFNLLAQFQQLITGISNIIKWLFIPSTVIGIIVLIALGYFFIKRLGYHLVRRADYHQTCPVCQSKLYKRHRKKYQHFLSYLVPIRRYHCNDCGWDGVRIYKPRNRHFKKKKN